MSELKGYAALDAQARAENAERGKAKTKRQLRAEAVERLKKSYYTSDSDLMRAMLNWGHGPHTGDDSRFALIGLLTDDEPDYGDEPFCQTVKRWLDGDAPDECRECGEGCWHELHGKLCAESYMDAGADAEKASSREADGCGHVTFGGRKVTFAHSLNEDDSVSEDTREKLESDVRYWSSFVNVSNPEGYRNMVLRWLDRQAAITEREWKREWGDYQQARIAELKAERDNLASDLRECDENRVEFKRQRDHLQGKVDALKKELRAAKVPHPYVDRQGCEVAVGDIVWGQDGIRWRVTGIRWGSSHPVQAVGGNGVRRDLKPLWLTHERPDSWGRVTADMELLARSLGDAQELAFTVGQIRQIAERIEKLGGAE